MTEYAAFGVQFYWLVDPALGSFEIFSLDAAGCYVKVVGATAGVVDSVPGCPGLMIDVDALWRQLSRLSDVEPRIDRGARHPGRAQGDHAAGRSVTRSSSATAA
jgi:hypothetical protein